MVWDTRHSTWLTSVPPNEKPPPDPYDFQIFTAGHSVADNPVNDLSSKHDSTSHANASTSHMVRNALNL